MKRDDSIDILRGLVMCLMVLDHARDFATSTPFSPTDASHTTTALFVTRWVTHFCAPVFMLLAGAGSGLSSRKPRELSLFLLTRGLWLVVLELTWVRFGWTFNLDYHFAVGQVIWALGLSMIFLAGIVPLGPRAALFIGAAICISHNLLDPVQPARSDHPGPLWTILHVGGAIEWSKGYFLRIAYPVVPWIGVISVGYWLGSAWRKLTSRQVVTTGIGCTVAFFILRGIDHYGDPVAWSGQASLGRTVFSFFDVEKYPPSLDYLLATLGPALIFLGFAKGKVLGGPLLSIGRAPLFFYLLHLPLVHLMVTPLRLAHHLVPFAGLFNHGLDEPLWVAYVIWIAALALLYWPTKKWAELKATRRDWWLSYL